MKRKLAAQVIFIFVSFIFSSAFAKRPNISEPSACDANFIESYLAKKNCLIYADKDECSHFALIASTAKKPGGTAALVTEQLYKMRLGPEDVQDHFTAIVKKMNWMHSNALEFQKKKQEIYQKHINKLFNSNPGDINYKNFRNFASKAQVAGVVKQSKADIKKIIESTSDPKVKALYKQLSYTNDTRASEQFVHLETLAALKNIFPKDYLLLSVELEKLRRLDMTEHEESKLNNRLSRAMSFRPTSPSMAIRSTTLGNAGLGLIIAKNIKDKNQIDKCQDELKLSAKEISIFKGEYKFFNNAKVSKTNSIECSDLKFVNPEKSINELLEKFGDIPTGSCNILKNESDKIDELFAKDEINIDNASCDKFEADNVKLTGAGLNQIFEYTENNSTVRTKFDPVKNWPIFSEAEVFKGSQLKPDAYLTEDLKRSFPTPTAVENEDRNFDVQDIRTYSSKCTKDSAKKTSVCGLFKAAMLARVKSTMFQKTCIDGNLKAGTTSNAEPVKDVKTGQ